MKRLLTFIPPTVVSRAFQILSDPDKKSKFDKFGGDPESRFGAGGGGGGGPAASPFSGFARSAGQARNGMFEEEMSPEDLFRQFFGGGMGMGGPFGMSRKIRRHIESIMS